MVKKAITKQELLLQVEELRSRLNEAEETLRVIQGGEVMAATEALKASEARFRVLAEATSAAIFITEGLRILYANDAAQLVTGYSCDELLRMEFWQMAHPAYQGILKQHGLAHPWAENIPSRFELRIVTPDGDERWLDVTSGDIEFEGRPASVVTAFDITERDRAEKELRKARDELELHVQERTAELTRANAALQVAYEELRVTEEELRQQNEELIATRHALDTERQRYLDLFDFAPDGYLVTNLHGVIQQANRSAMAHLQVSQPLLVGKPLSVFVAQPDRQAFYACLNRLRDGDGVQSWEGQLQPQGGAAFYAAITATMVYDPQGQPDGLRWLIRDVTEHRRAENEIANLARFPSENPNPILRLGPEGAILYANEASDVLLQERGCGGGSAISELWRGVVAEGSTSRQRKTVDVECEGRVYSFVVVPITEAGYVNLYGQDITERKQAEEALQAERNFASAILDTVGAQVVVLDRQGRIVRFNRACEQTTGYSFDEVKDQHFWNLFLIPEEIEPVQAVFAELRAGQFPQQHENYWVARDGGRRLIAWNDTALLDSAGSVEYIIGTGLDITERKRAEEALKESERRFRLALKNAPVSVATQDRDLRFTWAYNQRTARPEDIIGKTDDDLFAPEDAARLIALKRQVLETGEDVHEQLWLSRPGGSMFLDLYLETIRDEAGQVAGVGIATVDLTERKRAEQERERLLADLEAEKARWQAAVESMLDPVTVCDAEGRATYMNAAYSRVIERAIQPDLDLEEHSNYYQLYHLDGTLFDPCDLPLQRAALTGEPVREVEIIQRDLRGGEHIAVWNAAPLHDTQGHITGAVAVGRDITRQRKAEAERERLLEENRQQRRLLETLLETDPDGLDVVIGNELVIQLANPAYQAFTPCPTENPVGRRWDQVWAGATAPEVASAIRRVLVTGEPVDEESQKRVYPDGRTRYFSFHVRRLLWNAEYAALIVLQETTAIEEARRRVNEAAQEAQRRAAELDATITAIADGVMIIDRDGMILRMNPAAEKVMGNLDAVRAMSLAERVALFELETADGVPLSRLKDTPAKRALTGEIVRSFVLSARVPDQPQQWLSTSAAPVQTADGRTLGAVVSLTDITELRQTQQRLQESNEQLQSQTEELQAQAEELQVTAQELSKARDELEMRVRERTAKLAQANVELRLASAYNRSLLEANLDPLVTIGPDGQITDVNTATEHVTGCPRAELIGTDFSDYFTDPEKARAGYRQVFREGLVRDYGLELCHRDGRVTPVLYNATVYRDEAGNIVGVFAAARDITERRRSEEQLSLQSAALEAAANAIIITDRQGNILWANPAFTQMTGYSALEILGQNPRLLKSGLNAPDFYRQLWKTILSWQVWRGEIINRRKDGSLYTEEQTITPVLDINGGISHFIAIKQDVTDRKQAEEEIRQRNRELAALNAINAAVSSSLELSQVMATCQRLLVAQLDVPGGAISFYEEADNLLHLKVSWGLPDAMVARFKTAPAAVFHDERVIREKQVVLMPDLSEVSAVWMPEHDVSRLQWQSYLCIPLLAGGKLEGVLDLFRRASNGFNPNQVSFFEALGHEMGVAIQNARLYERELRARQIAETLSAASLALTQTLDLDTVMETLLDSVGRLVPYDSANVMLLESESRLAVRVARGYERWADVQQVRAITFDVQTNPILNDLFTTRKSSLVSDSRALPGWERHPGVEHVRSWIGVPLIAGGNVIGMCSLDKSEPGFFTQEHVQLAEMLVGQAAVAIQNAWLFEQVRAGRERLQSLSRRLVEVQESERRYVARELHDEAGQALTSLMFGLGQLEQSANPPELASRIAELKQMTNAISESLHQLAMDLRPASLDYLGLVPALHQYVEMVGDRYSLIAQFKALGFDGERLLPAIETALYRIVQEAMTNVVRHARATRVDVLLERRGDKVIVVVEDNGVGFDADAAHWAQSGRLGLSGMQERAEMLGGSLVVESSLGAGATIVVEVPYADSHPHR